MGSKKSYSQAPTIADRLSEILTRLAALEAASKKK